MTRPKCSTCRAELIQTTVGPVCIRPGCPGHRYMSTMPETARLLTLRHPERGA